LHTSDRSKATRLLHAKNEAGQQPAINLQIARAYLVATDPQIATRTWQFVMDEIAKLKKGPTQDRWVRAMRDKAFDSIRQLPVLEIRPRESIHSPASVGWCFLCFIAQLPLRMGGTSQNVWLS